jgi:phosphate transport system substrate-binding protein
LFLLVACVAMPTPRAPVRLTLVGSDSMQSLARALGDVYSQPRPYVTITVQASNSANGLRAAREISGTIGMVARAIKPSELDQTRAVVIARDGVAVIVNRNNPINAIMRSQIVEIFSGQVATWPLGPSAGKSIVVISREEGSGTRDAFETMVMGGTRVTRTAIVMPNEASVVDYVAHYAEAIGYCSMGAVTQDVRALTVDDVPLSPQTVENKQYPFIRTFAFIVPQTSSPEIEDFVAFVLSAEGQRIVAQKYGKAP